MREFSKFEEKIIKYIVASRWKSEVNDIDAKPLETGALIARHMNALAVSVNTVDNQFYVHAREERAGKKELLEVDLNEIFDIIGLLRYLDKEYHVDFYELKEFKESEPSEKNEAEDIIFFWSRIKYELINEDHPLKLALGDILIDRDTGIAHRINQGRMIYSDFGGIFLHYANTIFHPNEELRDLVKNDFKTPEQQRFRKQQWATWISIGIAFAVGIATIWISICK